MHTLTASGSYSLEIILKKGGQTKTVQWKKFSVGCESSKYQLSLSGFIGGTSGLGDQLSYHDGAYFSTRDKDNTDCSMNCIEDYGYCGWWFKCCSHSRLNRAESSKGPDYGSVIYDESTMILKRN